MPDDLSSLDAPVATTGRLLTLPPGPIFHLQRAEEADYQIGAFRSWAGYKDLGSDAATGGVVLFQHVLSFGSSEVSGRTGIHCHLAHAHIVIPTSGRGVFSYDGVVTDAVPGVVIAQHGGTVHDQFSYSYAAASDDDNRRTPLSLDPVPPDAPPRSFAFLELFVPGVVADVEIVAPDKVTPPDQASAWIIRTMRKAPGFALQKADDPEAAWRPVAGAPWLEARDGGTWAATGRLVSTHILRATSGGGEAPIALDVPGEDGRLELFFVVAGSALLGRPDGPEVRLQAGDCLTCTAGLAAAPREPSADLRMLRFLVSARAEQLRAHSPAEIRRLGALGPAIIRRREIRPPGDTRAVNFLRQE